MASKGQKFKKHSYKTKIKIVNEYFNNGGSTYSLSKKYNIPVASIKNWIKLYKTKNEIPKIETRGKSKPERLLTLEDYKERYEILKKYQAFHKAQRERK